MKRVFLIVLDSFGIGPLPDSKRFGDENPNTLLGISKSEFFSIPNLSKLGFTNIDGVSLEGVEGQTGVVARLKEISNGKDTTIGHWEIAGLVSEKPLPTYPDGFPSEILQKLEEKTGRGILCNLPYSGTEVIKDYGQEHVETGKLIVYTSADSVLQIAAHEEIVPLEDLYSYCRMAREIMQGEHAVGRIIARPFITKDGAFVRTANRRDFSLEPTKDTLLDVLKEKGYDVIGVGKISDIFASKGITESIPSHGNDEGMEIALDLIEKDFSGLAFINLVDFDMIYGHRNDVDGYAKAISRFDAWLPSFLERMGDEDTLIITADHGCDPSDVSTDHTREYVPFVLYGKNIEPKNAKTMESLSCVAATVAKILDVPFETAGESII
jgi:phosphopentomutase